MSLRTVSLRSALESLPENALEAVVSQQFASKLLEALGFESEETHPEYSVGRGAVDKAARKNVGGDIFLYTGNNPYLLVELKGRDINLLEGSAQYQKTVRQLKQYLLSERCQTAEWGIITNSRHIQLFRKHGKVIFPATSCLPLNPENVDDIAALIREKIEKPTRALTVTIYNNKGGVGKTTTTVNLAGILTLKGKKVLAVDFDPNQQDLTSALGLPISKDKLYKALTTRSTDLRSAICPYTVTSKDKKVAKFDVIPADQKLVSEAENDLKMSGYKTGNHILHQKLQSLKDEYDYILIDAPPNWRLFSKLAVYAADVILIPTKHNNLFSLENAATAITSFIPEMQREKNDGSPIALPIFFNGEKMTDSQQKVAHQALEKIIGDIQKRDRFDLEPYVYSRRTRSREDNYIPCVPSYASIASAAFARVPAVYCNSSAREYYKDLVKGARYEVIGNSFVYAVAEEAGLERVWCIIADDSESTAEVTRVLAGETVPKVNLSKATRDEIKAALEYLIGQSGSPLKSLKLAIATNRIDEAPRQYWKTFDPITALKCGITKGTKLDALKQAFYLTPQPMPETITDASILKTLTTTELKAMAKKRGIPGLAKLKKDQLIEVLSQSED